MWWGGLALYFFGVLTGAALAGWNPEWVRHWEFRRWRRRAQRTEDRMISLVNREAERIRRE